MSCCSSLALMGLIDEDWIDHFIQLVAIASGLDLGFLDHIDHLHPATKRITTDVRFTASVFPKFKELWCDGKNTHIWPFKETRLLFEMPPDPPHSFNFINEEMLGLEKKDKIKVDKTVIGVRLCNELEQVIKELAVKHVYGEDHVGVLDLRVIPEGARQEDYFDMLRLVKAKDMYTELKKGPPVFVNAQPKKEHIERIAELKREAEANAKRKEAEAKKTEAKKYTKKSSEQKAEDTDGSEQKAESKKGRPIPPEKMMELMEWYLEKTKLE